MSIATETETTETPTSLFPLEEYRGWIFAVARGERELPIPDDVLDRAGVLPMDVDNHLGVARQRVEAAEGLRRAGELRAEVVKLNRQSVGDTPLEGIKTIAALCGLIDQHRAERDPRARTPLRERVADLNREIARLRAGSSLLWKTADPAIESGIQVAQGEIARLEHIIARRRREFDVDGSAEAKLRKDLAKAEAGGRPDGFPMEMDPRRIAGQLRQKLRDLLQRKRDLPEAIEANEADGKAIASAKREIDRLKARALAPEAVVFGTREAASDGPRDFSTPFGP